MNHWIGCKAIYFKENGDIDRKRECDRFLEEHLDHERYRIVHASMYCNVYYVAVAETKRMISENGIDQYQTIPEEQQDVTAIIIATKTESKELIFMNYEKESDTPICIDCPNSILRLLTDTEDENALKWRELCHKNLKDKRKLLRLDGLPEGTRIQFPSMLTFTNGVSKGDLITLQKINRKWVWNGYRFMKRYINPDYKILQKERK